MPAEATVHPALVGGCAAPAMQLHVKPNGDVLPCCWSIAPLGNLRNERLVDIWGAAAHRDLIDRLDRLDFSAGCRGCEAEAVLEGRAGSHLDYFDQWRRQLGEPWPPAGTAFPRPRRIEFELSNACNLQCIQCSGEYSSAIRIHREKRPPLASPYDEQFFADVELLLPDLVEVSFAGGEPFLGAENFRIWESLARVAPHVPVTITTNATIWNDRVERVLAQLPVDLIVSLDAITPEVYEAVREGSSFPLVMANLERFLAYARANGRSLDINFCFMPATARELPELLRFAEARGIVVNVVVVRSPAHCSLASLDRDELVALVSDLEEGGRDVRPQLVRNAHAWDHALANLRTWVAAAEGTDVTIRSSTNPNVLMFAKEGSGPHDDVEARADLARRSGGATVHAVEVDADDRIVSFPPELAARLGVDADALRGAHPSELLAAIERWEPLVEGPDRVDADVRFAAGFAHCSIVALRGDDGTCQRALMLLAFDDRPRPAFRPS